ncbi:major capsid protein [Nocardioides sp. R-C-SC26]|uniref:major capsid protein n=1 Tax=Nocardioides sp. R-C-SC26 TaxID=2870414 RepID=UPI001E5279DD|nr:major capsid protein [Nocardioides sp. R-C-SC26]
MNMQMIELVPSLRPFILAARQMRDSRNSLEPLLPNVAKQAVSYRLGRKKRLDQIVPIRAIDAPAIPIRKPGVVEVRGDLPAITPIVDFSEMDLTQEFVMAQQLAGIQVDWSPWVTQGAALCAATTDNTLEQMRGQVLSKGVITLETEDGATHEADFEIPAANKIEVNTPWDPTDPTEVFESVVGAHGQFLDSSGDAAGAMLTTRAVYDLMVAALQLHFPQQPIGSEQLGAYLASKRLPSRIITNDRKFTNADGTKTRVYPEGHLTFLPSADGPVGETELGVTQEAIQQMQKQVLTPQEVPGMTLVTLGNENPVQRAVKGATIGMPVLRDNEDIVIMSGLIDEEA